MHEVQHAIQHIEGFAEGGNKNLGFAYAMNMAYYKAKNSQDFRALSKEEKFDYLMDIAYKEYNAKNTDELGYKAYRKLYGETEARQVTLNRQFDADLLSLAQPDMSGNVVDAAVEAEKFIENFGEMGYTEEEIKELIGGNNIDESGSFEDIGSAKRGSNEKSVRRPSGYGLDSEQTIGGINVFENENRRKTSRIGRGIQSEISTDINSGGMVRGIDNEDYSIPSQNSAEDLLERYESGEITRQEYLDMVKKEKTLNPKEIANLTEEDANTTPHLERKKGKSDGDKTSKFHGSLLGSDIFDNTFNKTGDGSMS